MKINPNALSTASSWKSLLARRAPTPAAASLKTTPASAQQMPSVQTGGALNPLPKEFDLQKLFNAWGTADATYDVTKNGVVDAQDLAVFLSSGVPKNAPSASPDTVLKSWGQPGGAGDVNGDGKTDGADLALALGGVQPAPAADVKSEDLVAGVQKAWGTNDKSYDFNKDGTVDGVDLGMALSGAASIESSEKSTNDPMALATAITDKIFAARDLDQNDVIAFDELPTRGAQLAARLDADRSGSVNREELRDRIAQEFSTIAARSPQTDMRSVADRWLNAFIGRHDPAVGAAKALYSPPASRTAQPTINQQA